MGVEPVGWDALLDQGVANSDSGPAFYLSAQALAGHAATILEVGCGRGALATVDSGGRAWQDLRGPGRQVVGIDIEPAGSTNPVIDEFRLIGKDREWPVADASVDLAISDFVLEHVAEPGAFVGELARVLRPGGMFVARTINRHSLLASVARAVPNRAHAKVLAVIQPGREAQDVFPTAYLMNSRRHLAKLFDRDFEWSTQSRTGLDHYLRRWGRLQRLAAAAEPRLPRAMQTALIVYARRR